MALSHDNGPAPYSPVKNIVDIIDTFRDRGLGQPPFTTETFLRLGLGTALAQRAGKSLRLLDLIDNDGNPTETMEGLRTAPSDQFKERMAEVVRVAYEPVLDFVDPSDASPEKIRDAFRVYTPHGQQDQMVRLFIGLCEYAEIRESAPKRRRTSSTVQAGRKGPTTPRKPRHPMKQSPPQTMHGVPLPIAALMEKLPSEGGSWSEEEHDRFMTAFEALLSFSYRLETPGEEETDNVGGEDE